MKRTILSIIAGIGAISASAQMTQDSVNANSGITHDVYYSLSDGQVAKVENSNWDLAFDVSGFGSVIRVNDINGTKLYLYPKNDKSGWSTVDTSGISSWEELNNSPSDWYTGAFNQNLKPGDDYDLGWGTYSVITHKTVGDSIYVLELSDGSFRKFLMQDLSGGAYNFKYANLDGSNEKTVALKKSDYTDKNFGYYSLVDNKALDREPVSSDWDLIFCKYLGWYAPGTPYGVTGVLTNAGLSAAKVEDVAIEEADYKQASFSTDNNVIGWKWKSYDFATHSYTIPDSLSYFVYDQDSSVWHIVFNGYGDAKFEFKKELLEDAPETSVENIGATVEILAFPNPVVNQLNITSPIGLSSLRVYDLNGKIRFATENVEKGKTIQLDTQAWNNGIYIIQTQSNEITSYFKIKK